MKKNLLVSFSGGETSAYMAQWLWKHKQDEYNMVFVFANTGQENQETIDFLDKCSDFFGFEVIKIEALVSLGERKGTSYKVVKEVDMNGRAFEDIISKYGIPNPNAPHCTREMKEKPLTAFAKDYFKGENFCTAIGIREDEFDRVSPNRKARSLIYPLISMQPMTKEKINFFWAQQPFRLRLKGYEGNCKTCWKKSRNKLYQIAKEHPERFDFFKKMEDRYENFTPESRLQLMAARGQTPSTPYRFFRGNKSVADILKEAQSFDGAIKDDTQDLNFQLNIDLDGESCEVFSECHS